MQHAFTKPFKLVLLWQQYFYINYDLSKNKSVLKQKYIWAYDFLWDSYHDKYKQLRKGSWYVVLAIIMLRQTI